MEKRTKKILLVSGSLLLIGGALWLWWKNRPKKDEVTGEDLSPKDNAPLGIATNIGKPIATAPTSTVIPSVKPILVPAKDVLSGNINGANRKAIYAGQDVQVYNMSSQLAFTVKKGDYIGYVTSARASNSNFLIYILKNNVKYYLPSTNVLVKTN